MNIQEWWRFLCLAARRKRSSFHYIQFQQYQARHIIKEIKKRIPLAHATMLELGCGHGGYSAVLAQHTKKLVIADREKPSIDVRQYPNMRYLQFDASKRFPLKSHAFDVVFCSSVIEHVDNPRIMLAEMYRVLKEGGAVILTFPPFYSPVGGHKFKPFHYLGETLALRITNFLYRRSIRSYATTYGSYGLIPRKISDVERLLRHAGFHMQDTWVRFLPLNVAKIPLLREWLTWHVNFYCTKEMR